MELDPACRDLIEKLIVLDPAARLGMDPQEGFAALKRHPFFKDISWSKDMTKMSMKRILRETEPMEMRRRRVDGAKDKTLPEIRYALVMPGQPILKGNLLKKNKFYIKQERRFELFMEGYIKYYDGDSLKGTMELTPNARCQRQNRTEAEILLPENRKNYHLVASDPSKCPPKAQYFSCHLDCWVEAINYVCETLKAEQE